MSLQKKYYYTFKGLTNIQYQVEIWQNTTTTITPEEIRGDSKPFTIEYPETKLFEAVKGSGCELNIVSTTDRKYINLYTANMLEFQIRFYKAGNLIWCGYLDSELYNEPFTEFSNYTVTFTGSDGFALLDRLNYVDGSGGNYNGFSTQWDVLQNILTKLNLPYQNIYIGLSTTTTELNINSNETLLHKTYCNNSNWYNEDEEPETARKVLESILLPYGAYIVQDQGNVYITDINTIAGASSSTFKRYNNNYSYLCDEVINLNLGDLNTIGFAASDSQMSVVSGYNKQVIKYSPYIVSEIIEYNSNKDFSDLESSSVKGSNNNTWVEKKYSTSSCFSKNSNGSFIEYIGTGTAIDGDNDKFLSISQINTPVNDAIFTYTKSIPKVIISDGFYLKIEMKAFVRSTDEIGGDPSAIVINDCLLFTTLSIGDKYYSNYFGSTGWGSGGQLALAFANYSMGKYSNIVDKWIDAKLWKNSSLNYIIIPLDGLTGNDLNFSINYANCYDKYNNFVTKITDIKEIRIKDINLKILDKYYNELKEVDIDITGFMNANYKNTADEITLYQGTSINNTPTERGAMLGYNNGFYYLKNWNREGKTDCIENLLLRSTVSNYTNKRIQLTATSNLINKIFGCITYQKYIADKNLMIVGITQNFEDNTSYITVQEVIKDNLDINNVGWK